MSIKIGTYNLSFLFDAGTRLHSGKPVDFSPEFVEQRFACFAAQFDLLDADILFLQELGDESALVKVLEKMKSDYSSFVASPDGGGVGNAVIYKSGLQCTCESIPSNALLPAFAAADQSALGTTIPSRRDYVGLTTEHNGKKLTMLGVHIKGNFLMYEQGSMYAPAMLTQTIAADAVIRSEMFRLSQAKRVRELVDAALADGETAQVLVLGDFNSKEGNKVLDIVRGRLKNRPDSLMSILDQVPEQERWSVAGKQSNALIDYVLSSPSLVPVVSSVQMHNKDLKNYEDDPSYPYIIPSDHAAITFVLN
ncbi:MAG: hypothetical protein A2542_00875 [Parcubacteria group bacterium RIFOXYD2_FULL_52_8]|nr:MAG: hypothetical protein A2542_00875 [Parcubacteria group bacterium RIFOXYD2_FULL_52_8]